MSRVDIARREKLSRARVTQIMSLLTLDEDVTRALLNGDSSAEGWSIRRALARE
ncbi:MAG: hypothetical protein V3V08_01655 [Nannocystaceae bacterium]